MKKAHVLVHFSTERIIPHVEFKECGDQRPFYLRLGDVSTWLTLEELDALLYEANTAMRVYDSQAVAQ